MTRQKIADSFKNAIGTVFLLAGAFFVCSTFLSIRSVFADPIAPINENSVAAPQSGRASNPRSGRASPRKRANASRTTVARTTTPSGTASRAVSGRPAVNRATAAGSRNVVSRASAATSRANAAATRSVRARTATTAAVNNARISLQGSAIRGSKATPPNVAR